MSNTLILGDDYFLLAKFVFNILFSLQVRRKRRTYCKSKWMHLGLVGSVKFDPIFHNNYTQTPNQGQKISASPGIQPETSRMLVKFTNN